MTHMRKRIVEAGGPQATRTAEAGWLNLSEIATVEVTSEQEGFPVEAVFSAAAGAGWRAARPGEQLIRLLFDEPAAVSRIRLSFEERERERTQEFTLSWCPASGGCREIVRQQWNFSPSGSTTEIEDYAVTLDAAAALELRIQPDISGNEGIATLAQWRVSGRL